jgi:hypothetical protein
MILALFIAVSMIPNAIRMKITSKATGKSEGGSKNGVTTDKPDKNAPVK